jgi:hypothetical protein
VSFIGAAPSGTAEKAKDRMVPQRHQPQPRPANRSLEKHLIQFRVARSVLVAVLGLRISE